MHCCSMLIGICNLLFGKDPVKDLTTAQHKAPKPVSMTTLMELIWRMMKIPTFALIIVQVCPWPVGSGLQQLHGIEGQSSLNAAVPPDRTHMPCRA